MRGDGHCNIEIKIVFSCLTGAGTRYSKVPIPVKFYAVEKPFLLCVAIQTALIEKNDLLSSMLLKNHFYCV
jgi:hypothetical protein